MKSALAIIGGGRWARVYIATLAQMELPFAEVIVVSKNNQQAIKDLINSLSNATTFTLVESIDELIKQHNVTSAIIVNLAQQHFASALKLISAKINVLIEKPIVLSITDLDLLLQNAAQNNVQIVPGLNYRFCAYLHNFAQMLANTNEKINNFSLHWTDASGEIRYGEKKSFDSSIDIAQDVMPHIWTILSIVFPKLYLSIKNALLDKSGDNASCLVSSDSVSGEIIMQRSAQQRIRLLNIQFDSGKELSIDFKQEPGEIYYDGETISADPEWNVRDKPVKSQLKHFFSVTASKTVNCADLDACKKSVEFYTSFKTAIDLITT